MFKRWVTISACLISFVLIHCHQLRAQSIPARPPTPTSVAWEMPIRPNAPDDPDPGGEPHVGGEFRRPLLQVQYVEPLDVRAIAQGSASHQVIRAPRIEYSESPIPSQSAGGPVTMNPVPTNPAPSSALDPLPHLLNHHATQAPPAVIPDASHREVWKSPYSYGFFGARGSRQWTRHYGYRDRGKEWRLR